MSYVFYVDVPNTYQYDYVPGDMTGPDVLTRELGVQITFICNSVAKISEGDVHAVTVESEKDELFFLLKSGFKKMDTQVVETYLQARIDARRLFPDKARFG
jgi:hypothetical protein